VCLLRGKGWVFDFQIILISMLIFIYMLHLPEGQKGEAWEPPKKSNALSEIREVWLEQHFYFVFKELNVAPSDLL
jgi:hypothetical protein